MKERWYVRWFRRRALLYHLLVLILAPGCLYAAWWQIHRAEEGNTLSYLYSIEWPIFAIMAIVGWWQLIHEDPAAVESRKVERARRAANRGPFVPPPPETDSGFFHPLPPGARAALDAPGAAPMGSWGAELGPADTDEPVAVHALSSYNAYLAKLSAGGGRKSWRNPRGITAAINGDRPSALPGPDAPDALPSPGAGRPEPARPGGGRSVDPPVGGRSIGGGPARPGSAE